MVCPTGLKNFLNVDLIPFVIHMVLAAPVLLIGFKVVKVLTAHLQKRRFLQKLDSNIGALIINALRVVLNVLLIIVAIQILGVPSATIVAVVGSCALWCRAQAICRCGLN